MRMLFVRHILFVNSTQHPPFNSLSRHSLSVVWAIGARRGIMLSLEKFHFSTSFQAREEKKMKVSGKPKWMDFLHDLSKICDCHISRILSHDIFFSSVLYTLRPHTAHTTDWLAGWLCLALGSTAQPHSGSGSLSLKCSMYSTHITQHTIIENAMLLDFHYDDWNRMSFRCCISVRMNYYCTLFIHKRNWTIYLLSRWVLLLLFYIYICFYELQLIYKSTNEKRKTNIWTNFLLHNKNRNVVNFVWRDAMSNRKNLGTALHHQNQKCSRKN